MVSIRWPPDYHAKRLTTRPSSWCQLVGNPGRKPLSTGFTCLPPPPKLGKSLPQLVNGNRGLLCISSPRTTGRVCLASLALQRNEEKGLEFLVMHNQEELMILWFQFSKIISVSVMGLGSLGFLGNLLAIFILSRYVVPMFEIFVLIFCLFVCIRLFLRRYWIYLYLYSLTR